MMERPSTLHYKAILDIYPQAETGTGSDVGLLPSVLGAVRGCFEACMGTEIHPPNFQSHGVFDAPDKKSRLSIASIHATAGAAYPLLWAAKLIAYDKQNPKRSWCTHLSITAHNEAHLTLCYASMYSDAGGQLTPIKAPARAAPPLITGLLDNAAFACCSGQFIIPSTPIEMTNDLIPVFMDMLNDPDRTIPVILICCPDVIDPYGLCMRLQGNAALYYISDVGLIFDLNDVLPQNMRVDFESVCLYAPTQGSSAQHNLQIPIQTIIEQGPKNIVASISRAYSESLRGDERRQFVTVDDILTLRNERQAASLKDELEKNRSVLKELRRKHDQLVNELNDMKMRFRDGGIHEYEELLDLCLKDKDQMVVNISDMIERLYTEHGKGFKPQLPPSSIMHQLERAIQFCIGTQQ